MDNVCPTSHFSMHLPPLRQQCRWWFYQSWERSLVLWQRPRTGKLGVRFGWVLTLRNGAAFQSSCLEEKHLSLGLGCNMFWFMHVPTWLLAFWSFLNIFDPSPTTGTFQTGSFPLDQKLCFFSKEVTPQLMVELEELVPPYVAWICLDHVLLSLSWRDGFDGKQIHAGQK